MEENAASDGDQVLLSRDPFAPQRVSDVDFRDVFGGPPRRGAVYEPRRTRADSLDVQLPYGMRGGLVGEELGAPYRRSSLGLGVKPVFGEGSSPARRRQLGDGFFSDIFPGSDSSCSTPRRNDRGPFASSPGSRVLSPSSIGGSALPARLSHSVKFAKEMDHAMLNSPSHHALHREGDAASDLTSFPSSPKGSMPVFTNQTFLSQEEQSNEVHPSYRQRPLSRQFTSSSNRLLETTGSASFNMDSRSKKDPTDSDSYSGAGSPFHFSIFNWASKGATLVLPPDWKSKNQRRIRVLPEVVVQVVDINDDDKASPMARISKADCDDHESKLMKDRSMERKDEAASALMEDPLPVKYEVKNRRVATEDSETERLHEEMEDSDRGQRSTYSDLHVKQHSGIGQSVGEAEATSPKMQDAPVSTEDKVGGRKVKGKIKDFIKIFNQDVSSKLKDTLGTQDQKSRAKDGKKRKVEDQPSARAARTEEEIKVDHIIDDRVPVSPIAVNPTLDNTEDSDSNMEFDVHVVDDSSSNRNDTSMPDSAPGVYEYSGDGVEEPQIEYLEECLVEPLSQDQNIFVQTDTHEDLVQIADSKIREWSKGRVGNIRSLLSTLQYVLWPESGWKPVPLVDIIEGSSVKRAYQKALLCLHPDKLQQRGAAMHQKHIAEKVFDILQEAWDHFNSSSDF